MKLPLPALHISQQNYVKHIRPLLNDAEFCENKVLADRFFVNVAPRLQKMLEAEQESATTSWLYKHWLQSYLRCKGATTIEANFALNLRLPQNFANKSSGAIINLFARSLAQLCRDFAHGDFAELVDGRGNKLCLNQFQILRGASRIPQNPVDGYNISQVLSNYITVFYRDNLYKIEVFDEGEVFDLENCITEIIAAAEQGRRLLSSFSFLATRISAKIREELHDTNLYFDIVENSLFSISIINQDFRSDEDKRAHMLYLNGSNSWVLKPLNFIFNLADNEFFINADHSFEDAGTIVEIIQRAFAESEHLPKAKSWATAVLIKEFVDEKNAAKIKEEREKYLKLSQRFFCKDIHVPLSNEQCQGLSKDSVMQFLMLYAHYKTYGRFHSVYEAVDMREYQFGRTECVRPLSDEAVTFVRLLEHSEDKDTLQKALVAANEEHKNRIKNAKKAQGIDRHLFGLQKMLPQADAKTQRDAAEFFASEGYRRLSENFISTTCTGNLDCVGYLLFTPVVWHGLGVTYLKTKDEAIFLVSYHREHEEKATAFGHYLGEAVVRFKQIFL